MTDSDLNAIRSRYLGVDKKKRKIRKMNDRKFVFDWDEQDDTYNAETPAAIGSQRQGAQIMFGRGHIAGMDDTGGVAPVGQRNGPESTQLADPLERRKAARSGLDERHWTEKSLEEMKERDWRIFREDFSIAARGKFLSFSIDTAVAENLPQAARFRIPSGHGKNLPFHETSLISLTKLATRNPLLFNDKLFLSVCKIEILLVSRKPVCSKELRLILF